MIVPFEKNSLSSYVLLKQTAPVQNQQIIEVQVVEERTPQVPLNLNCQMRIGPTLNRNEVLHIFFIAIFHILAKYQVNICTLSREFYPFNVIDRVLESCIRLYCLKQRRIIRWKRSN